MSELNPRPLRAAVTLAALTLCTSICSALSVHVQPSAGSQQGSATELYKAAALLARASLQAPPDESFEIVLAPGDYWLNPLPEVEPTCGNCQDPATPVPITVGLSLSGRRILLRGAPGHASVLHTRSGYGILFRDCRDCLLQGVVVTGGERDTSGQATDAAVVVQRSSVRVEDCRIRDNMGDPGIVGRTVVGIIGIAGREGSEIEISGNRIERNSWDGIALYRGARARILGNVIDGVDLATGGRIGGGRGVGIGLTWDARAEVRGNLVRRYWKGIGVFVDARATVEENIVERVATWGLTLWDAGRGRPQGYFRGNAVDSTGACGASIVRQSQDPPSPGCFCDNALTRTGQNPRYDSGEPYCLQKALARHAVPDSFVIRRNLMGMNREAGGSPGGEDLSAETFRWRVQPLCRALARWPALRESAFLRDFLR